MQVIVSGLVYQNGRQQFRWFDVGGYFDAIIAWLDIQMIYGKQM